MNNERIGLLCSLLAAVGYTVTNGFLRAVSHCDAAWVSAVKASWILIIFLPGLLLVAARGHRQLIGNWRAVWFLVAAGFLGQFGGNLTFQWSLQHIGVALAVPLCLGTLILSGAVIGKLFLNEPVDARAIVSMLVLFVAIIILNLGSGQAAGKLEVDQASTVVSIADQSETVLDARATFWKGLWGGAATSFAGFAYAILGVAIRYFMRDPVPLATPMIIVGTIGVFGLGAYGVMQIGWSGIAAIAPRDWLMMTLAGIANAAAFLALTKALELVSIVKVNLANTSQVAMGAFMGVLFFNEPFTRYLLIGCLLTMIGLLLKGGSQAKHVESTGMQARQASE